MPTVLESYPARLFHGVYLKKPIFTHGQLYVAVFRVTSKQGLNILIEEDMVPVVQKLGISSIKRFWPLLFSQTHLFVQCTARMVYLLPTFFWVLSVFPLLLFVYSSLFGVNYCLSMSGGCSSFCCLKTLYDLLVI